MKVIHAANALTPSGWEADVRIGIEAGRIASLETGRAAGASDERHAIVLSGMPNLHSHAFQRGMAGLAEVRGLSADSFWSWRETMYRFALSMTPDQMETVAAQAYVEMLEAGFTRVGEFHYLHHDRDGGRYSNIAETSERIVAAVNEQRDLVVACSALKETYRAFLARGVPVEWAYLKGRPYVFRDRLRHRTGHFMTARLLTSQFDALEEPADAIVVDASQPPEAIVDEILTRSKAERHAPADRAN